MSGERPATTRLYANRYRAGVLLGKGNFGQVFLAEDLKTKDRTQVKKVLKRIPIGDTEPDENLDAVQEAQLMKKLHHPCIVQCFDSFLDGEYFCIVTEFCEGGDLDVYLTKQKRNNEFLEEQRILTWFVELLCALQYIHSRGVLHRDLKTRNIFIREGMLKLGDFGISRILMTTGDMATTFVGTPYYMSPEVLKHDGYDSKSDIWSLGCILVEMCTLQRPFEGSNIMNVMWNIMQKEVPRISAQYDSRLQVLADKILNRNPEKRPSAMEILGYDIVAAHVRRLSSKRSELAEIVGNSSTTSSSVSKSEVAVIRSSANDRFTMDQLRKEEREKKLSNLDPRERRRLRKQEEADQRAAQLSAAVRENRNNFSDLKQRKQDDLRGTLSTAAARTSYVRNASADNPPSPPAARHVERTRSAAQAELDDSDDEQCNQRRSYSDDYDKDSVLQQLRAQQAEDETDETDVPDDPDLAETHYGAEQFDRDSDSDDYERTLHDSESDEETLRALARGFQETDLHRDPRNGRAAASLDNHPVVKTRDEIDAYGPQMRETKMKNMRSRAIEKLGQERFEKVYSYLKMARGYDGSRHAQPLEESVITNALRKLVGSDLYSHCFLVDQLLFFEEQTA